MFGLTLYVVPLGRQAKFVLLSLVTTAVVARNTSGYVLTKLTRLPVVLTLLVAMRACLGALRLATSLFPVGPTAFLSTFCCVSVVSPTLRPTLCCLLSRVTTFVSSP